MWVLGMVGTPSGSHRHVTKMEMWTSSELAAAALAMSASNGNHLISPGRSGIKHCVQQ